MHDGRHNSNQDHKGSLRIAVDIGGTFTDLAAFDENGGVLSFGKALSTHHALVEGIRHSLTVPA